MSRADKQWIQYLAEQISTRQRYRHREAGGGWKDVEKEIETGFDMDLSAPDAEKMASMTAANAYTKEGDTMSKGTAIKSFLAKFTAKRF